MAGYIIQNFILVFQKYKLKTLTNIRIMKVIYTMVNVKLLKIVSIFDFTNTISRMCVL